MPYDLSILIPARHEMFLQKTIDDILSHIEADTEIIVVLDGEWSDPPLMQSDRVNIIYSPKVVGQRAATNMAARIAQGKYLMKVDAHCSFDQGFDRKMIAEMHDDWTMVPMMRNLWAFDWVCPDGHRRYQSPSGPCGKCKKATKREITWRTRAERGETAREQWNGRKSPENASYCFDTEPHFKYFREFTKRAEGQGDITPTMSLQGSCFMCTRERYFALNLCDESLGSWGSQGIEVACKTWLSGGAVMCNKKTWYAHLFRTQGGDFGFPYQQDEARIQQNRKQVRDLFFNNQWPLQKRPISWLLEKFWPVKGWTEDDLKKLKPL